MRVFTVFYPNAPYCQSLNAFKLISAASSRTGIECPSNFYPKRTKKRDARAKLLFCLNLLLFCRSRCLRSRRCLSSLMNENITERIQTVGVRFIDVSIKKESSVYLARG